MEQEKDFPMEQDSILKAVQKLAKNPLVMIYQNDVELFKTWNVTEQGFKGMNLEEGTILGVVAFMEDLRHKVVMESLVEKLLCLSKDQSDERRVNEIKKEFLTIVQNGKIPKTYQSPLRRLIHEKSKKRKIPLQIIRKNSKGGNGQGQPVR